MSRAPLVAAVAVLLTAVPVAEGVAGSGRAPLAEVRAQRASKPPTAGAPAPTSMTEPADILRTWDARRARAWARGDPTLLRPLYTPGSAAGRHDRAMLRAWAARGLAVHGLHTQLLSIRAVRHDASSWTLVVTDRLVGGVAVGPGVRRPLPRDQATTRTVTLRRAGAAWRVASVLPGGRLGRF